MHRTKKYASCTAAPVNASMSAKVFHVCLAGIYVMSRCRVSPAAEQGRSLSDRTARTDISFGKIRYVLGERVH